MADLNNLAQRVEAAHGADRELDALIWCAIHGKRYRGHNPAYGEAHLTQVEYTEPPKRTRLVTGARGRLPHALPLTASIDAAMTLVPEGWAWMCGCAAGEDFFADLSPTYESGIDADMISVFAATPALALCAAALRGRQENTNVG